MDFFPIALASRAFKRKAASIACFFFPSLPSAGAAWFRGSAGGTLIITFSVSLLSEARVLGGGEGLDVGRKRHGCILRRRRRERLA